MQMKALSIFLFAVLLQSSFGAILWCDRLGQDWTKDNNLGIAAKTLENSILKYPIQDETMGPVYQVTFPQGSDHSVDAGHLSLYPQPPPLTRKKTKMCLSYKVKFQSGFDFSTAGKLPGLGGYAGNPKGCTGGTTTFDTCFSARFMWRTGGTMHIYAYIPEGKNINNYCKNDPLINCRDGGSSWDGVYDLGRLKTSLKSIPQGVTYNWKYNPGKWGTIYEEVSLNSFNGATPNEDGYFKFWWNNLDPKKPTYKAENLAIRKKPEIYLTHILYHTFFGGDGGKSSKNQWVRFTDFVLADSCEEIMAATQTSKNWLVTCPATAAKAVEGNQLQDEVAVDSTAPQTVNSALVIGISIGAALLVVIVVVLVVILLNRSKRVESA